MCVNVSLTFSENHFRLKGIYGTERERRESDSALGTLTNGLRLDDIFQNRFVNICIFKFLANNVFKIT